MLNKVKAGVGGNWNWGGALYERFQGYCGWFGRGAGAGGGGRTDGCADGRTKKQGYTLC